MYQRQWTKDKVLRLISFTFSLGTNRSWVAIHIFFETPTTKHYLTWSWIFALEAGGWGSSFSSVLMPGIMSFIFNLSYSILLWCHIDWRHPIKIIFPRASHSFGSTEDAWSCRPNSKQCKYLEISALYSITDIKWFVVKPLFSNRYYKLQHCGLKKTPSNKK